MPAAAATLVEPFPDLELANSATHALDMTAHFSGTGLTYEVLVTTIDRGTGEASTAPINTAARDRVAGAWSGDVLTLTAGPSGHHVLGMEVIATDVAGGTASDGFQLTVGASEVKSLAREALKNALAARARSMLEEASATIVGRMNAGTSGNDVFTAFTELFGVPGLGDCPLEESLDDCMERDRPGAGGMPFEPSAGTTRPFGGTGLSAFDPEPGRQVWAGTLEDLRDLARNRGFAISLNEPLPRTERRSAQGAASAPDEEGTRQRFQRQDHASGNGPELTLWGQNSRTEGGDTLFWGLDASMGEHWMTGLAFAESDAEVTQSLTRGDASVSGLVESEIDAVYPYFRSRFDSGLELWSLMGWGSGRLDSTWTDMSSHAGTGWLDSGWQSGGAELAAGPEETIDLDGDVAFDMGLVGARQMLLERGGFSLFALGDAGWSRLAVTSGTAEGIEAKVSRTNLGLEGHYVSEDGAFSSNLHLGARVDGGDGQTASGLEITGDIQRSWDRWFAGAQGRWYTTDTTEAVFGGQGIKATLGLAPREDGTGLGFTLSPGWNMQAESSKPVGFQPVDDFRSVDDFQPADDGGSTEQATTHLDGRVSWGMKLPEQGLSGQIESLGTYAEFSVAEEGTGHLQTGLALETRIPGTGLFSGLLTPHAELRLDQSGARRLQTGLALETRLPGTGLMAGPLTPHAELRLDQDGASHLRAGVAFGGPVSLSLAADRLETASGHVTHAIMLRLDSRF